MGDWVGTNGQRPHEENHGTQDQAHGENSEGELAGFHRFRVCHLTSSRSWKKREPEVTKVASPYDVNRHFGIRSRENPHLNLAQNARVGHPGFSFLFSLHSFTDGFVS